MQNINYQSDFQLSVDLRGRNLEGIPFKLSFYTVQNGEFVVAEFDGSSYTNCSMLDDHHILVTFNDHGLKPGRLKVRKEFHVENSTYPDSVQTVVDVEDLEINLVNGKSDTIDPIRASILQTFLKPVKGVDYFTPSERAEFKQSVITILKEDNELFSQVFNALKSDPDFKEDIISVVHDLVTSDEAFITKVVERVYESGLRIAIENTVKNNIISDATFKQSVAEMAAGMI